MDEDLKRLIEEHRFRGFDLLVIGLTMLGIGFALALLTGCASVDVVERYGLPKGYKTPFVVVDGTGEQACVLYPDGHLDTRGRPELAIRVLIMRLKELAATVQQERQAAARRIEQLDRQAERQTKDIERLRKEQAESAAKKDD